MLKALDPRRGPAPQAAVEARVDLPCTLCPLVWCDAPWSSGRTGCPACAGRIG